MFTIKLNTIDRIKDDAKEKGSHFFDRDTMRFFRSRVSSNVYNGLGGIYFVTSEQFSSTSRRGYTVRKYEPKTGDISSVSTFNTLTSSQAHRLASNLSKQLLTNAKAA